MGQWDKLIEDILALSPNLRFEELYKALVRMGYEPQQPRGGSSHYVFRKRGCTPITLPKRCPMKRIYIQIVSEAVKRFLEEGQ